MRKKSKEKEKIFQSQYGSPCYLPHAQQTEVCLQSRQQQRQRAGQKDDELREISQGQSDFES